MRHWKTIMALGASVVLTVFLGLAGCGDDHRDHIRSDRDRYPEQVERHDGDRHEVQQESDRHDDRGRDTGHEGEHGDR